MQALIFASGNGKRLQPLTNNISKCMVSVGGCTIIDRMMQSLIERGITDIIVTTGAHANALEMHLKNMWPKLSFTFVRNNKFATTNYIYSLYLARRYVTEEVLTFHADLLYESTLLKKLIELPASGVLINNKIKPPEKDFKALVKNNMVKKIGVYIPKGEEVYFCLPIYKFLPSDWALFIHAIEPFVAAKNLSCYAEDALNTITDSLKLVPVYYGKEPAMEIDTLEDLKHAEKIFSH